MPAGPTDRTHIVIAILAELIHDRAVSQDAEDAPYMTASDAARLDALATGLSLAVDHGAVADTWRVPGTEDATADWIANIITGKTDREEVSADTRREEVAVARRLADVAASLRVRCEVFERESAALWDAASRLLGLETKPAESPATCDTHGRHLARTYEGIAAALSKTTIPLLADPGGPDDIVGAVKEAVAILMAEAAAVRRERNEARHRVKTLEGQVDSLKRRGTGGLADGQVDLLRGELAEVRRERDDLREQVEADAINKEAAERRAARERNDLRAAMRDDEARHVAEVERIKNEWAASDARLQRACDEARAAITTTQQALAGWREWAINTRGASLERGDEGARLCIDESDGDHEARHTTELERLAAQWRASDQRLVAAHALEVRALTEQLAAARTPTVAVTTHTAWVPPPPGMPMPHHRPLEIPVEGREVLRQTIARLGVRSVALYWGPAPGDLSIVVVLCDGKPTLDEIADALEASHDLKRGTYRLREVKAQPVR